MATPQASLSRELNPGQMRLNVAITYGSSGAVASYKGQGIAASGITATGTGQITLVLDKPYTGGLIGYTWGIKQGAVATLNAVHVSGNGSSSTSLVFETRVAAGTATNPASGDVLYLELVLDEQGIVQ